ncbi:hypothetical protein CHS0354_031468 [Potamilus streckersoni]|uniref:Uncharacterized protein n=1 Tax=Potamilus streckersoni TaxID=2493646 RepID=A0AAE0VVT6_9BIVA|nr:hypothetical protein CHS0354_031468 [Potamilus streckersoni]
MSVPLRFVDPEYVNWLRCASSLVILKESLHDYTQDGVNRLHVTVKHSVTTRLGSQYQCSDCSCREIHQHKSKLDWYIKCKKSICNVWLSEILNRHNEPQCKTINWRNADITKWSIDPWEIAKIYMTKGQWNNVNLPQELDSPAILSLLKYCKEFDPIHEPLVSKIIDTRNKVFHSTDQRVSDTDKDTWMDLMLLLVSDLNIQGVTYTNIYKLKTEDIDVSFRDQELKVLQNLASEIRNEVRALKGESESLKNIQGELREEIEKVKGTAGDHEAKIIGLQTQTEQLEIDLRGQKLQMELYVQVISSFKGFIDNDPYLSNIKVSEEFSAIFKEIHSLQGQFQTVESQLASFNDELILIRADQEKMKTEMRVEHQAIKEEVTTVKDEQEKMKTEMRVEHQAIKEEVTTVKDKQEKMKTEMRVEHQAIKEEVTTVKDEQEKMKTEMRVEHQAIKEEVTTVKDEQEKMKTEMRVEHQAIKEEVTTVKDEQEKMKTEMRVEHQDMKEEVTTVKDEQEKMKTEMRVEHQAMKEEVTTVKDEQEKMKTEMRVEHQAIKEEVTAVKDDQEKMKTEIDILKQDKRKKETGSSNIEVRNHAQSSELDIQEIFNNFDTILKFVASKSDGVKAIDIARNCNLGTSSRDANPWLYFLQVRQLLFYENIAGSQKKLWRLGPKMNPSDQELKEYAAEKLAKGKR